MTILSRLGDFFSLDSLETKAAVPFTPATASPQSIEAALLGNLGLSSDPMTISAVRCCVRVIAEGLALPACYIHRAKGSGRALAADHPLFDLLNLAPNDRQTSYEFREMLGWQMAMSGNAYVYIVRSTRGDILELLPCDPGFVSVTVDQSRLYQPVQYLLFGQRVAPQNIWHLKGPSWLSWQGVNTVADAHNALKLASATEAFGNNLFINGAKPGAIIAPAAGTTLRPEEADLIRQAWSAQTQGVGNAHKTILLNSGLTYTPMATTPNDAQWIESRRFQIEEVCRFFRVSPTKVFQQLGSHSYASVEQAHIQHDFETDLQWAERFTQSANKTLLSAKERAQGFAISLDNRAILRGTTANERMAYLTAAIQAGIMTQNEARLVEGYDPVDDPDANKLMRAANIMGMPKSPDGPQTDSVPKNNK